MSSDVADAYRGWVEVFDEEIMEMLGRIKVTQ
jgi:hypothetical protein